MYSTDLYAKTDSLLATSVIIILYTIMIAETNVAMLLYIRFFDSIFLIIITVAIYRTIIRGKLYRYPKVVPIS